MPRVIRVRSNTIQKLAAKYCKSRDLKSLTDDDGDIVLFMNSEELGLKIQFNLVAAGQQNEIFYVRAVADKEVSPSEAAEARALCNEYNRSKRWPKAYVRSTPTSRGNYDIVLEEQIDLETGVHQELFNDFVTTVIMGVNNFYEWLMNDQLFDLV